MPPSITRDWSAGKGPLPWLWIEGAALNNFCFNASVYKVLLTDISIYICSLSGYTAS